MNELSLYKLIPVIRRCLADTESMFTDDEIRFYLNESYARSPSYGDIRYYTIERLREKYGQSIEIR